MTAVHKKLFGCLATKKKPYICGVALAADNKNVERRDAQTRRNLVNFNNRWAIAQSFRPIRAWTAFIDSSIRFTRAFLAEYKSRTTLFVWSLRFYRQVPVESNNNK